MAQGNGLNLNYQEISLVWLLMPIVLPFFRSKENLVQPNAKVCIWFKTQKCKVIIREHEYKAEVSTVLKDSIRKNSHNPLSRKVSCFGGK